MSAEPAVPRAAREAIEAAGLTLDAQRWATLERYLDLLEEGNRRMNLTSVEDRSEAWLRHVADSLSLAPFLRASGASSVVDVGAGGGLPAFPLAIAMPHLELTLLESRAKKAGFLEEASRALGLSSRLVAIATRAELAGAVTSPHREAHEAAVARALAPLPVLLELTLPMVRVGGHLLAIKGERAEAEIAAAGGALEALSAEIVEVRRHATGNVVVVLKRGPTPARYPRGPGVPKRSPL